LPVSIASTGNQLVPDYRIHAAVTRRSRGGFEVGKDAGDEHGGIERFDDIIGSAKFKTARPV
jgi:hypothetical protein